MVVEQFLHCVLENPSWAALGLATCAGTYFLISRLVIGAGSVGNPFAKDHRRPRGTLVTDQTARDAILKQSEISFASYSAVFFIYFYFCFFTVDPVM